MSLRLRQVALVARALDPTVETLCAVLGCQVSFRDPGVGVFGLRNAVMPLGDTFLEVVSPLTPEASAARYLERRGGDAGYMLMLETRALDATRRRAEQLGVRSVWEAELPDMRSVHLHPRDLGGALLSLDQPEPAGAWRWAGPGWRALAGHGRTLGIAGADVACQDAAAVSARWSALLELPLRRDTRGDPEIRLQSGRLRFPTAHAPGDEGVRGVWLRTRDAEGMRRAARALGLPWHPERVEDAEGDAGLVLCGTRLHLEPGQAS